MPPLYQVYEAVQFPHEVDFEQSEPVTINDAFDQAARSEAEAQMLYEDYGLSHGAFVVQPSAWATDD